MRAISEARALAAKVQETTFKGRKIGLFLEEALTEVSIYFTEPTTGLKLRIRPERRGRPGNTVTLAGVAEAGARRRF